MRLIADRITGLSAASVLVGLALIGCGGRSTNLITTAGCQITAIRVSPPSSTLDHTAAAPNNTQHFDAFQTSAPPGCVFSLSNLTTATWSVSDTTNVSISNAKDATYGTATCKAATAGAVTVTATVPAGDGTTATNSASLTCN